jgi:Na+-transporting methylmalonyl-CoA/oxaloacetate decarboxylase gamma subunit
LGFQNIIDGKGLELSFAGLVIVFVALVAVASFISLLPILLSALDKFLPEEVQVSPDSPAQPDDSEIAAIAYAVAQKRGH